MEIWDAYYPDGTKAGFDLVRGEKVPEGICHMVCDILVKHTDGDYLLMQRDWKKPAYPGRFETSAGGSALKGEEALPCAKRELREETGIDRGTFTVIGHARREECFYTMFLCETDFPKDKITLQEGETIAYQWLGKADFRAFVASDGMIAHLRDRLMNYFIKEGICEYQEADK